MFYEFLFNKASYAKDLCDKIRVGPYFECKSEYFSFRPFSLEWCMDATIKVKLIPHVCIISSTT